MIWQQLILILANLINVYIDAYKITKLNRTIRHGINFSCYAAVAIAIILFFKLHGWGLVTFLFSAFFNRQVFFDVPLNLRRKLSAFYVSLARPPKSILDRIEIRLFGYNGKAPTICYGILWIVTLVIYPLIK